MYFFLFSVAGYVTHLKSRQQFISGGFCTATVDNIGCKLLSTEPSDNSLTMGLPYLCRCGSCESGRE